MELFEISISKSSAVSKPSTRALYRRFCNKLGSILSTTSIPRSVADADELIEEFGFWPSYGAFVREACLKEIREERKRLRERARTISK